MPTWLFKTEPDEYSIDDLATEKKGFAVWNGIRNYQARNFLRDEVKKGDTVLIYHSSCKPASIVGIGKVVKAAYVDPDQFDSHNHYYDNKSSQEKPRWYCVDVAFVQKFKKPLPLAEIKAIPELENMLLLKQPRLSIVPVSADEYRFIKKLAG